MSLRNFIYGEKEGLQIIKFQNSRKNLKKLFKMCVVFIDFKEDTFMNQDDFS